VAFLGAKQTFLSQICLIQGIFDKGQSNLLNSGSCVALDLACEADLFCYLIPQVFQLNNILERE